MRFENLLKKMLAYPKIILAGILLVTVFFFISLKKNGRMETDLDKYMPQHHPAFVYSNEAEKWFDIKDSIIIAVENKDGIYNSQTLSKLKELTKALEAMKEIRKDDVTSLYTAENIIGSEDGLDVKAFYSKIPQSAQEIESIRNNVRANDMVYDRLVSKDETVSVIIARIDDDMFSQDFYKNLTSFVKKFEGPEKLYVAGRPIVEGSMAYLGPKDMKKMVPIVLLVIVAVLLFVLRNFKSTILTILVVFFSVIWAFGLMAALKIPAYAVSTMMPVMLIAIGVADGIHLFSHLHLFMTHNTKTEKEDAVYNMVKEMWRPVVVTSVTTAVGFISLLTSEVYPVKYFGLFTAFGVMAAMLLSLLLIPAGILVFGLPKLKKKNLAKERKEEIKESGFHESASKFILKQKPTVLIVTLLIMLISSYGMTKIWINSSFLDKFERDSDIVLTDKFINEHFGGTSTLNVVLEGKEEGIVKNPEVLSRILKMQTDLEDNLTEVGQSFSVADYIRRMNKVMNSDKAEFDKIPDSRELAAQYLLMYEMSGDPGNLWRVVTEDFKKANITFQLKSDNSKALHAAIDKVEKYRDFFNSKGITMNYAGSGYKGLVFNDLILEGQIKSVIISLFLVIGLLSLMFKKFSIGLIGSVPIIITTVISFGLMGLFNVPLSTTSALLASIAIGIGIDYAVHFIERYKIYASETGSIEKTVKLTMLHSGRAILFNAFVVIMGFLVLTFSVFPPNRILGTLVSLGMFTSLIGTLTVMFIMLHHLRIYFKKMK
ncbi:MAG: efflux RND transporter permease subunit [Spirochaetia bacterium]|nr:efflux RND transporter permease subunit [Spirochaetia bacterium]